MDEDKTKSSTHDHKTHHGHDEPKHNVSHIKHKHHRSSKSDKDSPALKFLMIFGILLIAITLFNLIQSASINSSIGKISAEAKEAQKPAKIELVVIKDPKCNDCFSIDSIISGVKKKNVEIKKEKEIDFKSNEAVKLIEKYNIEKIPTAIITGQIEKANLRNFETIDEALVFTDLTPVYVDPKTEEMVGLVSTIVLKDSDCEECTDLDQILNLLKEAGIKVVSEEVVELDSADGKELIKEYDIQIAPTLIISKELKDYESEIVQAWEQLGSIEDDGSYVTREMSPPYINITSKEIVGRVSVTYLQDRTCEDCYDPEAFHNRILQSMGLFIENKQSVDVASPKGKEMLKRYSILKLPTIILKGDMEKYPALVGAWRNVGSVEEDGSYIFRRVEVANQPFKDLSAPPEKPTAEATA